MSQRTLGRRTLIFCKDMERLDLKDKSGKIVMKGDAVDPGLSWYIYFLDPDGNRLEVTTYDYGEVADSIWNASVAA